MLPSHNSDVMKGLRTERCYIGIKYKEGGAQPWTITL